MKTKCRKCGVLANRIRSNRVVCGDGCKRFVYRDEKGARWSGHTCPACKAFQVRGGERKGEATVAARKRDCRTCGAKTTNYFHCSQCYATAASLEVAEFCETQGLF